MVSVTWLYRSIVVLMVECPRRSCATFGCGSKPPDQNTSLKLGETAASRPCVNSSARRLCRNIFYKLHIMRTNDAADIRFHASSENCIFYISPISDFSHSLREAVFLFLTSRRRYRHGSRRVLAFYAGRPVRRLKCPRCGIVALAARSASIMKSRVIGTASRLVESSN